MHRRSLSFLYDLTNICYLWSLCVCVYVCVCGLFDDSHSDGCEVISHCGFDLHFCGNEQCWATLHLPLGHLYIFFGKMSVEVFCPFLKLKFSILYEQFIYFGYQSLTDHIICNYFLFFILISLVLQKLLSLIKSHTCISVSIYLLP